METSFPAAGMARQRDVKRMGVIAGMLFWRQGSIVRPGEATTDRQLDQGKPGVGSFFRSKGWYISGYFTLDVFKIH